MHMNWGGFIAGRACWVVDPRGGVISRVCTSTGGFISGVTVLGVFSGGYYQGVISGIRWGQVGAEKNFMSPKFRILGNVMFLQNKS